MPGAFFILEPLLHMTRILLLTVLAVVLAGAFAGPAAASAAPLNDDQLLSEINHERQARGLRPLTPSRRLARAANGYAHAMVAGRDFAHGDFVQRIRATGYMRRLPYRHVGENLAWLEAPSARGVVDAWLNSPGHRRVLLDPGFRHVGIGIADGTPAGTAGATVTADFGGR